jgi:hypothetical protein
MKRYLLDEQWFTIKELSEMSGIRPHTLRDRLRRGFSVNEAIKVVATQDSVARFGESSLYSDWIGMPMNDLFEIYWRWCISNGYTPLQIQGFSRQIMKIYPMLKTVPNNSNGRSKRIIRLRG